MTTYELMLILPGSLEVEERTNFSQKIKKILTTVKARLIKEEELGVRRLLYPVKRESAGYYFLLTVAIDKKEIKELRRLLNFETKLLRYMLLKVSSKGR